MNIRQKFEDVYPCEVFGSGTFKFNCVVKHDNKYIKIYVYADNLNDAFSKVNLRFGLIKKSRQLKDRVYKLTLETKLVVYLYN